MSKYKGTASNIEVKRWVTESKMFSDSYPVFAAVEDENGQYQERFVIIGCSKDGESLTLRLNKK